MTTTDSFAVQVQQLAAEVGDAEATEIAEWLVEQARTGALHEPDCLTRMLAAFPG